MSGLCLAIQLQRAGIHSYTILEKSQDLGGTWLENSYPGAGCDIPAHVYSFSFAPKWDWRRKYAEQRDILDYFRECADRFEVRGNIEFGTSVMDAHFDEEQGVWQIRTDGGEVRTADILVSAVGQLNRPHVPEFDGLATFRGVTFHSARWNHDFQLDGRDVAVIGNAASAIQFLPHVARAARKVCIFQRSPNYIYPRRNYAYPAWLRHLFRWIPGLARLHRGFMFLVHESQIFLFENSGRLNRMMTSWIKLRMRVRVAKKLRSAVTPDYPAGCKRILLSSEYLSTLQRDNVELVTRPIQHVQPDGIATEKGLHKVAAIIFATGFETSRFLVPMKIQGRNGVDLHETWQPRPKTYLGLMSPGFPNFFTLYGPNTNLGHNSIIFMVECQVHYVVRCLRAMIAQSSQTIEVRQQATEQYDRMLQKRLSKSVWNASCNSWYKTADGAIINNWCGSALEYWYRTRRPNLRHYHFKQRLNRNPE